MAFSNFTLQSAQEQFGLNLITSEPLFAGVRPVDVGTEVRRNLDVFGQLALRMNTEKARSEWLIAPVLGELWLRGRRTICMHSGVEFTFDKEAGLSGFVDFLIGKGPQVSFMTAPILALVEGKNESIPSGQGQLAAEMIAALRFNFKSKTAIDTVYGVVTTGDSWLFHRLCESEFVIDTRIYVIAEVDHILGILLHIVGLNPIETPV